jgi:hypothetical protein
LFVSFSVMMPIESYCSITISMTDT